MTGTPLDLLSLVRVGASLLAPSRSDASPAPTDGASFADLLRQAEQGRLASGLEVSIGKGVDLTLEPEQLTQLAAAADRAQASGAVNLMVLMDGKAITMDVQNRTITGASDIATGQVQTGVDAVISLPGLTGNGASVQRALPHPGGAAGLNPSLAAALFPKS